MTAFCAQLAVPNREPVILGAFNDPVTVKVFCILVLPDTSNLKPESVYVPPVWIKTLPLSQIRIVFVGELLVKVIPLVPPLDLNVCKLLTVEVKIVSRGAPDVAINLLAAPKIISPDCMVRLVAILALPFTSKLKLALGIVVLIPIAPLLLINILTEPLVSKARF